MPIYEEQRSRCFKYRMLMLFDKTEPPVLPTKIAAALSVSSFLRLTPIHLLHHQRNLHQLIRFQSGSLHHHLRPPLLPLTIDSPLTYPPTRRTFCHPRSSTLRHCFRNNQHTHNTTRDQRLCSNSSCRPSSSPRLVPHILPRHRETPIPDSHPFHWAPL